LTADGDGVKRSVSAPWPQLRSALLILRGATALAVVLSTRPAAAQAAEGEQADVVAARELFRQATTLEANGNWAEAESLLREAIALKETPGLRYHLAFAQTQRGKLVQALFNYDRAQQLIDAGAAAPDVQALLAPARAEIKRKIPTITLDLPADLSSLEILIDGRPVRLPAGQSYELNPGEHWLEVRAAGKQPFSSPFTLSEGEHERISAELRASVPSALAPQFAARSHSVRGEPRTTSSSTSSSSSQRTLLLVGEGVLVATGLGLGVWGLAALDDASSRARTAGERVDARSGGRSDACSSPSLGWRASCQELAGAIEDRSRATTLATAGFVTAGVGATAAIVTWLLWPTSSEAMEVQASSAPGGASCSVRGRF
jgi:hypothetical protein